MLYAICLLVILYMILIHKLQVTCIVYYLKKAIKYNKNP
jgi:hypothetical protein